MNTIGLVTFFCLLSVTAYTTAAEDEWGYQPDNGPQTWCEIANPQCCGIYQSPIDINGPMLKITDGSPVEFHGYNTSYDWLVQNIGHSLQLTINSTGERPTVSGGPLRSNYTFANMHFHSPAEHRLFSEAYDGEIHIVHYKTSAGSQANALKLDDGMAVVSFLIKIQHGEPNDFLDTFMEKFGGTIASKGAAVLDEHDTVLDSILPKGSDKCFYTYEGSLTTPPCVEDVAWMVHRQPVFISQQTLDKLLNSTRTTEHNHEVPLFPNNRPIQPRNGRLLASFNCK